jgi:hypothetical protein
MKNTPSRFRKSHSFMHQLFCPIGEASFHCISFKLGELPTLTSLALRVSLLLLYSSPKNAMSLLVETSSF